MTTTVLTTLNRDALRADSQAWTGRYYTIAGQKYLSVTNVLGAYPKDALIWWAAGMAASEAIRRADDIASLTKGLAPDERDALVAAIEVAAKAKRSVPGVDLWKALRKAHKDTSRKAADRGSEAHDMIERWILGDRSDEATDNPYFQQFLAFVATHDPRWIAAEAVVVNTEYRYAGTLDSAAHVTLDPGERVPLLLDVKTREDTRVFDNMAVQLAALAACDKMVDPKDRDLLVPWDSPKRAAILVLTPEAWRLVEVDVSDRVFAVFAGCLHTRHFQLNGGHELGTLGGSK